MPIYTFEGVMGSGKSLTANTMAYMEFYAREMIRFCFSKLKEGLTPKQIAKILKDEYDVDKVKAAEFLTEASLAINKGDTGIPRLRIYSNTELNIGVDEDEKNLVTPFDTEFFLAHVLDWELHDCLIILDEAYIYLDSRSSASKMNKLFTYFISQTRKRDVDLYICTQHIDQVDKRLRRAATWRGTCTYNEEKPCRGCSGVGWVTGKGGQKEKCPRCLGNCKWGTATTFFVRRKPREKKKVTIWGPAVYSLFDTHELVKFQGKDLKINPEDL
jgi:hypothetical protein